MKNNNIDIVEAEGLTSIDSESPEAAENEKFANSAQFAQPDNQANNSQGEEIELFDTPIILDKVYDLLPKLLKENSKVFSNSRERDVFLTGALTILSGCMDNVEGEYGQREVYANLYCFIVAPPASGKGVFIYAKMLGDAYHEKLIEESKAALQQYEEALSKQSENSEEPDDSLPPRPALQVLFIPGNASASAIIKHLMEGEGKGIFCETEADTLANSLKQDWGNFSDLLRKGFHHEPVSYTRKTNSEYYEIKKPRLTVAMSGTPSQVEGLIPSAEDGLFSRFIFYTFSSKSEWQSVSPEEGKPNLDTHFKSQSEQVLKMAEYLSANPTKFNLTKSQWDQLNKQFAIWHDEVRDNIGGDVLSTIKRLGLIFYRIAMVLSCLRKYENRIKDYEISCSDIDFKIAMKLVEVYKAHALLMFNRLPQTGGINEKMVRQFYDELPKTFKRKEAIEIGIANGMGTRTIDKYLQLLRDSKKLDYTSYGSYVKR
ncbi:DUF3987 domain-containing protein [Pontibacter ruber]|uniref:DUF3987 domain-containing protein n=1 Tax=Pontibacter ruber TaxID=1343895 RepID=A0ABW5CZ92_9BACT|nr:DUF3987 domain-containing protein [Pontibacter ruber]